MMHRAFFVIASVSVWVGSASIPTASGSLVTIDFESTSLTGRDQFDNGSSTPGPGSFEFSGITFNTGFNPIFGNWGGWSLSTMTDNDTPGFLNQYAAIAGNGAGGSDGYAVAFLGDPFDPGLVYDFAQINLPEGSRPLSFWIDNTAYATLSMLNGDAFAKKFGGPTGLDPDFLRLTITGYSGVDRQGAVVGQVEVMLADYRPPGTAEDRILENWEFVDLSGLGVVESLGFEMTGSDVGVFGLNTPAYFAFDRFQVQVPGMPEPSTFAMLVPVFVLLAIVGLRQRRSRRDDLETRCPPISLT